MTADSLLTGLCREIMTDLVTHQLLLTEAEVKGYVRREHGRLEEVRPSERLEGSAVHDALGVPELPDTNAEAMLDAYKQHEYIPVNRYLRKGYDGYRASVTDRQANSEKSLQEEVGDLDRLFQAQQPISQPLVVYRGMRGFSPERITPGTLVKDKAFMSTTTDRNTAERFAEMDVIDKQLQPRIWRITVPPGERAVSIENHMGAGYYRHNDEEHEVLLNRNHSLRVTGVHGSTVEAVLVPESSGAEEPQAAPPLPKPVPSKPVAGQLSRVELLARAAAYKKEHAALTAAPVPDRSLRFVWEPGDVEITRPPLDR